MTAKPRRKRAPSVGRNSVLRDSRGRTVDEEYVDGAVEDAIAYVRGRGRPSLSESGESPLLRVRVPGELDLAIRAAARDAGVPLSDWVRGALTRALAKD